MNSYTAEELAESYLNGNISHVRKILSTRGHKSLSVYKLVEEMAGKQKAEMFIESMRNA